VSYRNRLSTPSPFSCSEKSTKKTFLTCRTNDDVVASFSLGNNTLARAHATPTNQPRWPPSKQKVREGREKEKQLLQEKGALALLPSCVCRCRWEREGISPSISFASRAQHITQTIRDGHSTGDYYAFALPHQDLLKVATYTSDDEILSLLSREREKWALDDSRLRRSG